MNLFKAENCIPCQKLSAFLKKEGIVVPTTELSFQSLRAGDFPFKTVPSLVLEDGTVISGFPQIRLYLYKANV